MGYPSKWEQISVNAQLYTKRVQLMDIIDELTLLGNEDIDYTCLTDDILTKLTLGDDLFIATSALSELTSRRSPQVVPIAKEILCQSVGDRYLQAAAIESLFHVSPSQAVGYIKSYAARGDAYIDNSIAELIMENESYFHPSGTPINVASQRFPEHQTNGYYVQPKIKIHAPARPII